MFIRYTPEDAMPNVFYLKDSKTGEDWYDVLKTYDQNVLKIAVHCETKDIIYSFYDGSCIFPDNCDIIVPKKVPDDFISSPYGWKYVKSKFIHITSTEEYKKNVLEREIKALTEEYNTLKLKADLEIINNVEQKRLSEIHKQLVEKMS